MNANRNHAQNNCEFEDSILICVFLSDNHLQNVKTLQSIYKQKSGNIYLCLINNGLLDFQCERYIYNLNVNKSDAVKQVSLYENEFREDVLNCVQIMLDKFTVKYLYVMRAGERFESAMAIKIALDAINQSGNCSINCFQYSQAKKLKSLTIDSDSNQISWFNNKECMFLYNALTVRKMKNRHRVEYRFAQNVIPQLLSDGETFKIHAQKLCILDEDVRDYETR